MKWQEVYLNAFEKGIPFEYREAYKSGKVGEWTLYDYNSPPSFCFGKENYRLKK